MTTTHFLEASPDHVNISISPFQDDSCPHLPLSWKKDLLTSGAMITAIAAGSMNLPLWQKACFVGSLYSGAAAVYGGYETAVAGLKCMRGYDTEATVRRLKQGLILTGVATTAFVVFQTQFFTPSP